VTGSLTIMGSEQGSVDQTGAYTANQNLLSDINGQDVMDLHGTQNANDEADNQNHPDEDESPSGLVDVGIAVAGTIITSVAAYVAGGSAPVGGGSSGSGNTSNPVSPVRRREDEDGSDGSTGEGGGDSIDSQDVNLADNSDSNGTYGSDPYNDGTGTMSDAHVVPSSQTTEGNGDNPNTGDADGFASNETNNPYPDIVGDSVYESGQSTSASGGFGGDKPVKREIGELVSDANDDNNTQLAKAPEDVVKIKSGKEGTIEEAINALQENGGKYTPKELNSLKKLLQSRFEDGKIPAGAKIKTYVENGVLRLDIHTPDNEPSTETPVKQGDGTTEANSPKPADSKNIKQPESTVNQSNAAELTKNLKIEANTDIPPNVKTKANELVDKYKTKGSEIFPKEDSPSAIKPGQFSIDSDGNKMITYFEGAIPGVYIDRSGEGKASFGIGTLLPPSLVDSYIKEYGTYDIVTKTYQPPPGKDSAMTRAAAETESLRLTKNEIDKTIMNMNANIKVPLSQGQVNAISSYLYYRGSGTFNTNDPKSPSIFYKAINDRDIEGIVNFMLSDKSAQLPMNDGNRKRAYNTARYILGEISQEELLKTYETKSSSIFPESAEPK